MCQYLSRKTMGSYVDVASPHWSLGVWNVYLNACEVQKIMGDILNQSGVYSIPQRLG